MLSCIYLLRCVCRRSSQLGCVGGKPGVGGRGWGGSTAGAVAQEWVHRGQDSRRRSSVEHGVENREPGAQSIGQVSSFEIVFVFESTTVLCSGNLIASQQRRSCFLFATTVLHLCPFSPSRELIDESEGSVVSDVNLIATVASFAGVNFDRLCWLYAKLTQTYRAAARRNLDESVVECDVSFARLMRLRL